MDTDKFTELLQKLILIFSTLLLISGVGILAFIAGRKSKTEEIPQYEEKSEVRLTPTPTPKTSETVNEEKKSTDSAGKTTPSPLPKNRTIKSQAKLDGFYSSIKTGSDSSDIRVGRNKNLVVRGFLSFDISSIPRGAKIIKAELKIFQTQVVGSPFASKNKVVIDHLTYGESLDASDYSAPALISSFAKVSEDSKIGWRQIDVSVQIKDDLENARTYSQFRIHLEDETKKTSDDFVFFESAENIFGSKNLPELTISFY